MGVGKNAAGPKSWCNACTNLNRELLIGWSDAVRWSAMAVRVRKGAVAVHITRGLLLLPATTSMSVPRAGWVYVKMFAGKDE